MTSMNEQGRVEGQVIRREAKTRKNLIEPTQRAEVPL